VGAMMATAMSANVAMWIIPGQRKVVAALRAGQPVDPIHGKRGKQRSVHNTYFTLPVIFSMLSNHYSFLWNREDNWVVLVLMMAAGAAIRQFFVLRHGWKLGRNRHPLPYALAGVAIILATAAWMRPAPELARPASAAAQAPTADLAAVTRIMEQHCISCHGAQVQLKNVRLDSPESIRQQAQAIYQQVVVTRLMPMGNATGMTEEERGVVAAWFRKPGG
jgi:uncharacterized membrane protein